MENLPQFEDKPGITDDVGYLLYIFSLTICPWLFLVGLAIWEPQLRHEIFIVICTALGMNQIKQGQKQ